MRFLLLVTSVLLATNFLYAADDKQEGSAAKLIEVQTGIDNANRAIATANAGKEAIQLQIKAVAEKIDKSGCSRRGDCTTSAIISPADAVRMGKDIQKWELEIEQVEKSVASLNKSIMTLNQTRDGLAKAAVAPTVQRVTRNEQSIDMLKKQIMVNYEGVVLNTKLNKLNDDHADIKSQLNVIEKEMDNSKTGLYLQDKIGALLNSRLFCNAVKNKCLDTAKYVIEREGLKEIFPDISDDNSRSGKEQRDRTYDKKPTTK